MLWAFVFQNVHKFKVKNEPALRFSRMSFDQAAYPFKTKIHLTFYNWDPSKELVWLSSFVCHICCPWEVLYSHSFCIVRDIIVSKQVFDCLHYHKLRTSSRGSLLLQKSEVILLQAFVLWMFSKWSCRQSATLRAGGLGVFVFHDVPSRRFAPSSVCFEILACIRWNWYPFSAWASVSDVGKV